MQDAASQKALEEQQQYLLTSDSFENWLFMESGSLLLIDFNKFSSRLKSCIINQYLEYVGLPISSKIEGLE